MKSFWCTLQTLGLLLMVLLISCGKKNGSAPDPDPINSKSTEKSILSFSFNSFSPALIGTINGTLITVNAPAGSAVTQLVPSITVSAKASVSPSPTTAQDFSKDITYTVTAEDGSKQAYKVNVTVASQQTKVVDCNNVPTIFEDLGIDVDYIVRCNIAITGSSKIVTIKPGVKIQFEGAEAGITITNSAALKMLGTAAKPIVLEGKTASAGSWLGVQINSANIENQWEYVTLRNAGAGTYKAGLLIADGQYTSSGGGTRLSIKNCSFTNNAGYGIWDYDNNFAYGRYTFSEFENNTFTNNTLSALRITVDALRMLDKKSTYLNNGQKYIEVDGLGDLHYNTTMLKLDAPYQMNEFVKLQQKLTIEAGVEMKFYTDAGFILGSGTLIANGTSSNPIKFTGYKTGKGIWRGLTLNNTDPEISLKYCIIDGGGSNKPLSAAGCYGNLKSGINLAPDCNSYARYATITNCTISNSGGYGIIYREGSTNTISNNTFSGNTLDNLAYVKN